MKRRQLTRAAPALAALICAAALAPAAPARAANQDDAQAAVENCLAAHPERPNACQRAAEPFCGAVPPLECSRFEIEVWLRVAAAAERRLAAEAAAPPDSAFVEEAAADLRRTQIALCTKRAGEAPARQREVAREECLRERAAARAIAFWLVAPRP